jgi:hypothetical protein
VHGLDDLGETNAAYIEAYLGRRSGGTNLERYKQIIQSALHWDPMDELGSDMDFSAAEKACEAYDSASNDHIGFLELVIYGIEQANKVTLAYGDMDEGYYDTLEEWYQQACVGISNLSHDYDSAEFVSKMAEIKGSASGIGWGYHDGLCGLYNEYLEELGDEQ